MLRAGVAPFLTLGWFAALVVIGTVVGLHSWGETGGDGRWRRGLADCTWWQRFWYSLETALPLVDLNETHKDIRHGGGWVDGWFHFQKAAGFILASVLVGALTFG